jgi:methylmalonyl-CoA mutase cobalamin-binding subunit
VAVDEGWRVLYLGADLPGEEIGWAAVEGGATVIALSVVYPEEDEGVVAALRAVRSSVPPEIALVVGGAAAGSYRGVIRELGGEHVEDFGSFRFFLRDRAVGSASSGS